MGFNNSSGVLYCLRRQVGCYCRLTHRVASCPTLPTQGADVNAAPVPSSRDTALTIAADKGHYKFVELILRCGAHVDVKNKKGNSPLWLACNGEDNGIPFIENQCIYM